MRAAELLRSAGDLWNLADALWATQWSLLLLGRLDEAAKIGQEVEPLAARLGHLCALMSLGPAQAAGVHAHGGHRHVPGVREG